MSAGTTWEHQHLKLSPFYKAYIADFFLPSCFLSKLRRWIASCNICFCFFHCGLLFCVSRKKKPHCIVLLGMATTLLPKHFVKQAVMWTLKTEKERLHSWQHLLGDTMISWNACQNMELTLMQQIRLVMGEWFHLVGIASRVQRCHTEPYLWIDLFECCIPALFFVIWDFWAVSTENMVGYINLLSC